MVEEIERDNLPRDMGESAERIEKELVIVPEVEIENSRGVDRVE